MPKGVYPRKRKSVASTPATNGRKAMARMPKGIHVLRLNGGTHDIVEGNAREIGQAVRFWRDTRERLAHNK